MAGSYRVNRGGSWNNSAKHCRVSNRNNNTPSNSNNNIGLRLAYSSEQDGGLHHEVNTLTDRLGERYECSR